mgnify:CR=1 FL=1
MKISQLIFSVIKYILTVCICAGLFQTTISAQDTISELNKLVSIKGYKSGDTELFVARLLNSPKFEIVENIDDRAITLKFYSSHSNIKNTSKVFKLDLIEGYDFQKISDKEFWIVVRLKEEKLNFKILSAKLKDGYLGIAFTKHKSTIISGISHFIDNSNIHQIDERERITLDFNLLPEYEVIENELPYYKVDIIFKLTSFQAQKQAGVLRSNIVKTIHFKQSDSDLILTLEPLNYGLNYQIIKNNLKNKLVIDISDSPLNTQIDSNTVDEFVDNEVNRNPDQSNNKFSSVLRQFVKGEIAFRQKDYTSAHRIFAGVYSKFPNHEIGIKALFRKADIYYERQGNDPAYIVARDSIDQYLNTLSIADEMGYSSTENQRAIYRIANIFLTHKYYDDAISYFSEILSQYKDGPYSRNSQYLLGQIYYYKKEYKKSAGLLANFIENNTYSKYYNKALFIQGDNLYNQNQTKMALEYYNKALLLGTSIVKDEPDLIFNMAEAFLSEGFSEKSRFYYESLLELYPNHSKIPLVNIRLGDYFRDNNQTDSAIQSYYKSVNSLPYVIGVTARMRVANMLSEDVTGDDYMKSLDLYDYVIRNFPSTIQAEQADFRIGLTYGLHGEYQRGIDHFNKFEKKYPDNRYVKTNLINNLIMDMINANITDYFYEKKFIHSTQLYVDQAEYIKLLPERFNYLLMGVSAEKAGLFDQAIDIYNDSLEKGNMSNAGMIHFKLAKIFFEKNDLQAGIGRLDTVIDDYPESPYHPFAQKLLADTFNKNNEIDNAIEVYKDFIDLYKDSGNPILFNPVNHAYFSLGQLHEDVGRFETSKVYYTQTIADFKYPLNDDRVPVYIKDSFYKIGEMYYEMDEMEDSQKMIEAALVRYPNHDRMPWGKYFLGQIHLKRKNFDEALSIYKDLDVLGRENPSALWARLSKSALAEMENDQKFNDYLQRKPSAAN